MANVLTNVGKGITTARLRGVGTEPLNLAWGTGAGVAAITDTTLFTEGPDARVAGASSQVTVATANDSYRVVGTIVASAARTVTNFGLFDALTAGNLFVKSDFAGVALAAGDGIQFTATTQFT